MNTDIKETNNQGKLVGKIMISFDLELKTGMHIGAGNDVLAIGTVDKMIIRNAQDNLPIIPGSSLKGKVRSLLARAVAHQIDEDVPSHSNDKKLISKLFGNSSQNYLSKLQFSDNKLKNKEELERWSLTLPYSEVKYENTIDRKTGTAANPRQIERVPAGAVFVCNIAYTIEDIDSITDDLKLLAKGLEILGDDYLGGSGSRGYGRVALSDYSYTLKLYPIDGVQSSDDNEFIKAMILEQIPAVYKKNEKDN